MRHLFKALESDIQNMKQLCLNTAYNLQYVNGM